MVLYGAVWCCMVLYGVVWCCMVLYGVVLCIIVGQQVKTTTQNGQCCILAVRDFFVFTLFFYFVFVLFLLIFVSAVIFCSLLHVSESIWVCWLWILILVLEKFPHWFYVL